jgi:restriction endonuclease Mrr
MTYRDLNEFINSHKVPKVSEPLLTLVKAGFNHFKPIQFETFVLRIFEVLGFSGTMTPTCGDGGVDLMLQTREGAIIVQCKKYDVDLKVSPKELREFLGAILHVKAIHGYFITTSTFSEQAKTFSADHTNITLIDGNLLEQLFLLALAIPFGIPNPSVENLGLEFRKQAEGLRHENSPELEKGHGAFHRKLFRL